MKKCSRGRACGKPGRVDDASLHARQKICVSPIAGKERAKRDSLSAQSCCDPFKISQVTCLPSFRNCCYPPAISFKRRLQCKHRWIFRRRTTLLKSTYACCHVIFKLAIPYLWDIDKATYLADYRYVAIAQRVIFDGRGRASSSRQEAGSIHSKQDRMSWGNDDAGIVAASDRLIGDRRRHICIGGRKTDSPAYIALQYKKIHATGCKAANQPQPCRCDLLE